MVKRLKYVSLMIAALCSWGFVPAHAQDEEFPFDKPCLKYDQANFRISQEDLLKVMTAQDFPQYCELYSLSGYQIQDKWGQGYFIVSTNAKDAQTTKVFLKTSKAFKNGDLLKGTAVDQKPSGQCAYFTGEERFALDNGQEQEFYTFQAINF